MKDQENIKNRLNDDAYFEQFKVNMLNYAKENPKQKNNSFNKMWYLAAASVIGLTLFFVFINKSKNTQQFADNKQSNHQQIVSDAPAIEQTAIEQTLDSKESESKSITIEPQLIQTVSNEVAEENINLNDIDEAELIELISEESLDNWMKEYEI